MRKKLLALLLTVGILAQSAGGALAAPTTGFADMPEDWSRPALEQAVDNGLLQGSDGKIDPYGILTRAQLAAIVVRAFGATAKADLSGYSDMPTDAWYYDVMAKAVAMGALQGANGKLNPDAPVTRQESCTVLARAFLLAPADSEAHAAFEDGGQVADWAKPAMSALVEQGYIKGSNGKLMPSATMTRAEFAQLTANLVTSFDLASGTVEGNVVLRQGVTLPAGTKITGDLIVAEGVDVNALDLTGITITGRLVVRGGASVTLGKDTQVGGVVVANTQAPVSVNNNSGSNVDVTVAGSEEVTLNGGFGKVEVSAGNADVTLGDAEADQVLVSAADAGITVSKDAQVKEVAVAPGADNAQLDVEKGGQVTTVETAASGTEIAGTGKVSKVEAQAGSEGTKVSTPNTSVTVDKEAGAVETEKGTVEPGKTGSSSQSKPSDNSSSNTPTPPADTNVIYNGETTAPILMDGAYSNNLADQHAQRTYTQIKRAVGDLRQDIAMVTGAIDDKTVQQLFVDDDAARDARLDAAAAADQKKVPALVTDTIGLNLDYAIIVGAIDDSAMLQSIIDAGKLNEAETIRGKQEAYVIKEVADPIPGVKSALVIAGADARGAIYGVYTISEEIGVSPYYWYSDVPVKVQSEIDVDYTTALVDDGPDVKYRGIFINDEEYSNKWARAKFPTDKGTPDVNYYRHLFEVLLRMKGNTLWPAMHNCSTAFNKAVGADGVTPINAAEATKYGIIMGSSHCEIMLRNNVGEWHDWITAYNTKTGNKNTSYDFSTNETALLQYWRERLIANKECESVLTLGIRGEHDGAFSCANRDKKDEQGNYIYPGNTAAQREVSFMKDVITKQRALIAEVYGSADAVPQVVIPYKEMGTVYNNGLDQFLQQKDYDDIMIMWANDNFGFVRQTPNEKELARRGGTGIYYHGSYMCWQNPKSWLFLNSTQLSQMSEQLHRAYACGVRDYWILNVGDLKPGDIPATFFMKMSWDISKYDDSNIGQFLTDWARNNYGLSQEDAKVVGEAMETFYRLTGTKKAEFFGAKHSNPDFYDDGTMIWPFSVTAMGDEGQRLVETANKMVDTMTAAYGTMDADTQDAFYEQMYFHALAYRDIAEEYVYYWKNIEYADQGRYASSLLYAELSQQAVQNLWDHTHAYWACNDDKWTNVISPDHDYGLNQGIILLDETYYRYPNEVDGIGAVCEGKDTLRFNSLSDDTRYFDVFSKNAGEEKWVAEADDWIKLSKTSGATFTEERVLVTIDWSKVTDAQNGEIKVYLADANGVKTGDAVATFSVNAVNKGAFDYGEKRGYVEANGYVMIEAEHYSDMVPGTDGDTWSVVKTGGQRGDIMRASDNYPELGSTVTNAAKLVYNVYFEQAGTYPFTFYRMPTLNEGKNSAGVANACNTGVGVNGTFTSLLKGNAQAGVQFGVWGKNIMRQYEELKTNITVEQGWNTIEIYRSSPSVSFDRILIQTQDGAVAGSLVGPEESPNNIAEVAKHGVAKIPDEVAKATEVSQRAVTLNSGEVYTVPSISNAESATSNNPRAAEVKVESGNLIITAGKLGYATVTATLSDGSTAKIMVTVNYTVPTGAQGGAYEPKDGKVVIDAVDALEESEFAYTKANGTEKTWQFSGNGLQLLPDTGSKWGTGNNSLMNNAPGISFQVKADDQKYYLHVNTSNPNADADSFHVLVNGTYAFTKTDPVMTGENAWYDHDKTYGALNNSSGWKANQENIITIVPREDGFRINQIVLTTTKSEVHEGFLSVTPRADLIPTLVLGDMDDMSLDTGENEGREVTVSVTVKYAQGESAVTVAAESSDTGVATVSAVRGKTFTVTPVAEGSTTITVTASMEGAESVSKTFVVEVLDGTSMQNWAYQPKVDGSIVINAVDALLNRPYASYSNENTSGKNTGTEFAWVKAENNDSIQLTPIAGPNNKLEWTADNTTNTPKISFKVYVPAEGDYYLSFFSNSPNANSDSFHVGVNGEWKFASKTKITNGTGNPGDGDAIDERWFTCDKQALHLNEGANTITIWARESGLLLRQIMLTKAVPVPNDKDMALKRLTASQVGEPGGEEPTGRSRRVISPTARAISLSMPRMRSRINPMRLVSMAQALI